MTNAIEVRDVTKNYDLFKLDGVTFDVPSGYIMGFIGPNGAGKTTTIKAMLSVIKADSGSISVLGQPASEAANQRIGVVMDAPLYVEDWTLADVQTAISPFYKQWDKQKYAELLTRFGLDTRKKVKELSRGMKVKLQIAVALSHNADLLILDEPTSGLDPAARDEICDILREFVTDESKTVLFSTHITSDLEKTADFITFIMNGRIVFTGTKDEMLEKYARVSGGVGDLDADRRKYVIGYREHGAGFEGLIETVNVGQIPKDVLAEPASLEEIIIFVNREEKADA